MVKSVTGENKEEDSKGEYLALILKENRVLITSKMREECVFYSVARFE